MSFLHATMRVQNYGGSRIKRGGYWKCSLHYLYNSSLGRQSFQLIQSVVRVSRRQLRDMVIFIFFKMAAAAILDFRNFEFLTVGRVRVLDCVTVLNFVEIVLTVAEICEFQYYASLAWKCLFTPLLGFLGHIPQMMSLIVLTPKRTVLGVNHVIWAINREYFPIDFWMGFTRVLYFPLF